MTWWRSPVTLMHFGPGADGDEDAEDGDRDADAKSYAL